MYFRNFVIPRKDMEFMQKGERYPIISYASNRLVLSVQADANHTVNINVDDTNYLVVFNSYASDAVIIH